MRAYPDTVVGTDSHTTMVNGLGVLGWGVGGIEAEAAMLGQPVSMLIPRVVGFKLHGELPEGATATDLVLTITQLLRKHGVVGKFVEFYGAGVTRGTAGEPRHDRQHEPGVRLHLRDLPDRRRDRALPAADRPVRASRSRSSRRTRRRRACGTTRTHEPAYSEYLELDLSTVVPSIAGPKRPQDRVSLIRREDARSARCCPTTSPTTASTRRARRASRPPTPPSSNSRANGGRPHEPTPVTAPDGTTYELDHGAVVIASITSCTNTSNPQVMIGAALLAKNAVERGLSAKPWVKTTLAPGSKVVMDYYEKAGLVPYLDKLGFNLVGYGCTTCIGNSGPLPDEVSAAVNEADLAVVSVLSGNRNFEGRINPDVKMNYLASPPLVVAYAIAGTMDLDLTDRAAGHRHRRQAGDAGRHLAVARARCRTSSTSRSTRGDVRRRTTPTCSPVTSAGSRCPRRPATCSTWDADSTYVRKPPYFEGMAAQPAPVTDIAGARVLAKLGDSVTTDHISPAGIIKADSPAGRYLAEHGVDRKEFNSYGSRRGNHEVMIRGTFANIRLRNQLRARRRGRLHARPADRRADHASTTRRRPTQQAGVPLVILAGKEYGSGSSRDWAAKGTMLLGVRAVIAESYERIHRSNLIGMGVLPLQYPAGQTAAVARPDRHRDVRHHRRRGAERRRHAAHGAR